MTILMKPWSDKKDIEKIPLPLGIGPQDEVAMMQAMQQHGNLLSRTPPPPYNNDADNESMVFNRPQASFLKTILLFFIALTVMAMGVVGGYALYRIYVPEHTSLHLRGRCDIPYMPRSNLTAPHFYESSDDFDWNWNNILPSAMLNEEPIGELIDDNNYFHEEIEIDENVSKIDVPDFKDGRRGRFMHDFKENQSAIIDTSARRCFIMPLDRDTTMPPKSFMDLMQKMGSGYYNIDTDRVRRKMRVVTPPITDLTLISERIANECYDMKVYMLEKYISGVFKREVKPITDAGKFAAFGGKKIVEFDLINIADIEELEHQQKK